MASLHWKSSPSLQKTSKSLGLRILCFFNLWGPSSREGFRGGSWVGFVSGAGSPRRGFEGKAPEMGVTLVKLPEKGSDEIGVGSPGAGVAGSLMEDAERMREPMEERRPSVDKPRLGSRD